jgi:hypothetical protein
MELWVRSQDKETLIKSYELYIRPYSNIYVIRAKRTSNIMGLYKTKQRALEILDEIQSLLKPKYMAKEINTPITNRKIDIEVFPYGTIVYEMPEE